MNELKELEHELSIAEKYNFEKREINHLKSLIEKEKTKIKGTEKKTMNLRKILAWVIAIILMATYSYSIDANVIKVKITKTKKSKTEQQKRNEKKKQDVESEYELLDEPEKVLYAGVTIGSGSTLNAARKRLRHYIGFDISEDAIIEANRRLAREDLFLFTPTE